MSCSKDKKSKKPKTGRYRCTSCGVVKTKKSKLCDPEKVKKS